MPGWAALLVLLVIAGIGGLIDMISGNNIRGGFNIALVVASIVAILVVRHRDMFPIVVAPPLVYIVASGAVLYVRSGGLHNRKVLIDAAANWLVYGFPAIAGAIGRRADHRRHPARHSTSSDPTSVSSCGCAGPCAAPAATRKRSAAPRCA